MRKAIYALAVFLLGVQVVAAQTKYLNQLDEVAVKLNEYLYFTTRDFTGNQSIAHFSGMNFSGAVLNQWEVAFQLKSGAAIVPSLLGGRFSSSPNFDIVGNDVSFYNEGVNIFNSSAGGELQFFFIDEDGRPIYDVFSGERIGFTIPVMEGLGLGMGAAPALLPGLSLGLGYGTEFSFGILPGVYKSLAGSLNENFTIEKDMNYALGIKHDVAYWLPFLSDRNYSLSVAAAYHSMNLGFGISDALLNDVMTVENEMLNIDNQLTGLTYQTAAYNFELFATRKLGLLDLSLFTSYHSANYAFLSEGSLYVSLKNDMPEVDEDYTLNNLIDINVDRSAWLSGVALDFSFGRFDLGLKYAYGDNLHYGGLNLGYTFALKK